MGVCGEIPPRPSLLDLPVSVSPAKDVPDTDLPYAGVLDMNEWDDSKRAGVAARILSKLYGGIQTGTIKPSEVPDLVQRAYFALSAGADFLNLNIEKYREFIGRRQ